MVEYKKGKDNVVVDALSRKIEIKECSLNVESGSYDGVYVIGQKCIDSFGKLIN